MGLGGEQRKAEIMDGLVTQMGSRLRPEEAGLAQAFVRAYYRDVAAEDLAERDPLDLYGAALAQLRSAEVRKPGELKLRVYNPRLEQHGWQSTHTVVEIVNDDMPFLVDSVGIALARLGLNVHLVIHPVLEVRRDAAGRLQAVELADSAGDEPRESFMLFEVDRQTRPEVLAQLESDLRRALGDVRHAVQDWRAMRERIGDVLSELRAAAGADMAGERADAEAFLAWIEAGNFTLLGSCSYTLEDTAQGTQLRRVKGTGLGILRAKDDGALSQSFGSLPQEIRERAREPRPLLTVTKANTRSTVHRGTYLDFIGVKQLAPDGTVVGEHRFLGLLTSAAYSMSPRQIPLIGRKVERLIERAGFPPTGHAGKALLHIIETYPARRAAPDLGRRPVRDRHGHPAPGGPAASAPVRPARPLRAGSSAASSTCRATGTTRRCASAWRTCCARRWAPPRASSRRSSPNPSWRGCCSPSTRRRARRPTSTPPRSSGACSTCRAAGRTGCAMRSWSRRARNAATTCSTASARRSRPPTRSGWMPAPPCRTSSASTACRATMTATWR